MTDHDFAQVVKEYLHGKYPDAHRRLPADLAVELHRGLQLGVILFTERGRPCTKLRLAEIMGLNRNTLRKVYKDLMNATSSATTR